MPELAIGLGRPAQDQSWEDYRWEEEAATRHVLQALQGGLEIGHHGDAMDAACARALWEEFQSFFSPARKYYGCLGLGNPDYVFQHGVAIVDESWAGLLWIVESD